MVRFLAILFVALFLSVPAAATTVSPLNIEMPAVGPTARAHIEVTNTSTDPIAIEPTVTQMTLDEHGKAQHVPSAQDFLVLPPSALIPPGGVQTFRVQWLGGPDLPQSRSYMVAMNELPL